MFRKSYADTIQNDGNQWYWNSDNLQKRYQPGNWLFRVGKQVHVRLFKKKLKQYGRFLIELTTRVLVQINLHRLLSQSVSKSVCPCSPLICTFIRDIAVWKYSSTDQYNIATKQRYRYYFCNRLTNSFTQLTTQYFIIYTCIWNMTSFIKIPHIMTSECQSCVTSLCQYYRINGCLKC